MGNDTTTTNMRKISRVFLSFWSVVVRIRRHFTY